jgi:hypothetical protein
MKKTEFLIFGLLICVGLTALGFYINKGLQSFSNKERVVTVKGLAEKQIKATEAKITIESLFSGDSHKELIAKTDKQVSDIEKYLKEKGYEDLIISDIYVYDSKSYYEWEWNGEKRVQVKKDRYTTTKTIEIIIKNVEEAEKKANKISFDIISQNLLCNISCNYTFPELNAIKPELIAESTKNARLAGEQFAKDSQSKLGKIKTASQGQVSIAGRYYSDENLISSEPQEPYFQKVRVVSTIVFFLED